MEDLVLSAEKTPFEGQSTCTTCRKKRRRCDGFQPRCTLCVRNNERDDGLPCDYTTLGARKGRLELLQEKILRLEAQIRRLQYESRMRGSSAAISHRFLHITALPASISVGSPSPVISFEVPPHVQLLLIGFDPLIGSWWKTNEAPPSGLVNILIESFMEFEHHHTHDPRPPSFYSSLYDPNPQVGLHPALRNTILLLACAYRPGPLTALEPVFLRNATYYLAQSLARADRLLDYIEAYTLLTAYYVHKDRFRQAVHNGGVAMLFAAACGLHTLRPPEWSGKSSLLPPPRSRAEIRRRVRVWWMVYTLNRLGSATMNTHIDMEDEKILTIWDPPSDFRGSEKAPSKSVSSLFIRGSGATSVYDDSANAIRSKCVALVYRATYLGLDAVSAPESDRIFWEKFQTVERAIHEVASSLPSIFEEPRYEAGIAHVKSNKKTNYYTSCPHLLACDAMVSLHFKRACAGNATSLNACIDASRKVMLAIRQTLKQNMCISASAYDIVAWTRVFRVFATEYDRLIAAGDVDKAQVVISELKVLSKALKQRAATSKVQYLQT
ncbi:hypothetical protein BOTBODRAFT_473451 [Botryobasidium botryosum FD-172 SS1]|uniref:Zn(2)-C6 fungal-type domain-containing protein n=1 Tax=Botryobasidium botryosum (strain FD-172 SS1) TaxID=930990 RepID=A0A067M4V0_BOTB1|nr:hypothetical protein BOTBODRAFT_473451 [Botryobasidium botryosum FD-172 SS1]